MTKEETMSTRMPVSLTTVYGKLAAELPTNPEEEIILDASNLPRPPEHIFANKLAANWHFQGFPTPVPRVDFFGTKQAYRELGLLILSKLFHSGPPIVTLHLSPPALTDRPLLRQLILDYQYKAEMWFSCKPDRLLYIPEVPMVHPWTTMDMKPYDLPSLSLGHPDSVVADLESFLKIETGVGFGMAYGNALLGELLLNLGIPYSDTDEVALEGEKGARGVGPGSAEMRFFLPGHVFYDEPKPWPDKPGSK